MYRVVKYLPETNSVGADGQTTAGGPDGLLTDGSTSVGSVDHDALLDEDADVRNAGLAVTALAPEEHVSGLGLGAGDVLAHLGVVLSLSSAGYEALVYLLRCRIEV